MSRISITRFVSLGLVAAALFGAAILGAGVLTPRPAQAQVPPFKAYGTGLDGVTALTVMVQGG